MPKDLREYSKQTNIRLIVGGILILFIIGDGLIYFFYGPGGAATGFLCIGVGVIPIILLLLIFRFMDWIVKRSNRD